MKRILFCTFVFFSLLSLSGILFASEVDQIPDSPDTSGNAIAGEEKSNPATANSSATTEEKVMTTLNAQISAVTTTENIKVL